MASIFDEIPMSAPFCFNFLMRSDQTPGCCSVPPVCLKSKVFFSMATTVPVVIRSYFAFTTPNASLPSWASACLMTVIGSSAHDATINDQSFARSTLYLKIRFRFSDADWDLVRSE